MPTVKVEIKGLKEAMAMFDPKKVERAAASALKKVAQQARTEASSSIRERFNLKKGDVDKKIEVKQGRQDRSALTATLYITGRGISLTYFGAKERRGPKVISRKGIKVLKRQPKGAQGVQVKIMKDGKVTSLPNAFIATMKSGHVGVYIRPGKGRTPIIEKGLVSIPTLFQQKTVMERVEQRINEQWPKVFQQEMNYQLTKK